MIKELNNKQMFWIVFLCLLFVPIANTFFVNLSKLFTCFRDNYIYKSSLNQLIGENLNIQSKVKYYKSSDGFKSLVKDRLEKVDDGEILIKYSN